MSQEKQKKQAKELPFAWHWQETLIAGQPRPLAVASDPDAMLIDACKRQDEGETGVIDPFWATTWRAASGIDRFMDRLELADRRVLEVGCGTGHAGMAAAARGAQVTLTDGVEDPLHLVRMSLERNSLQARVRLLRLGQDRIEGERFDVILGSDVTYLRELWTQLLDCFEEQLTQEGVALLSDPMRLIANEFCDWIKQKPWQTTVHSISMDDDPDHPIRVIELRR
ncbi:MAG: methyltransferase domain-containing protein [Planctomycetota bacterium]